MQPNEPANELFELFPIPLRRIAKLVDTRLATSMVEQFSASAQQKNSQSGALMHSEPVAPSSRSQFQQICHRVSPHLIDFGELLLGERLTWTVKEMWINVLENGGRQTLHNHANSFISGVIYLTDSHASANTVFIKAAGSGEFVFNNTNARAKLGPYNAGKWVSPELSAGDMLLFPSYLLHEVPPNRGSRRVSLAFNAIPHRLDSWGYTLTLSR